jgi:hypothetical protein
VGVAEAASRCEADVWRRLNWRKTNGRGEALCRLNLSSALSLRTFGLIVSHVVKLLLDKLPPSLAGERETLAKCLAAMDRVLPLKAVYLFGSHARGDARSDSDVDLCLVADGATNQLKAAQSYRRAMRPIRPKPPFTLVPISPLRLEEKKSVGDHFFATVLEEGVLLATQN